MAKELIDQVPLLELQDLMRKYDVELEVCTGTLVATWQPPRGNRVAAVVTELNDLGLRLREYEENLRLTTRCTAAQLAELLAKRSCVITHASNEFRVRMRGENYARCFDTLADVITFLEEGDA